jgi:hypothetical protein
MTNLTGDFAEPDTGTEVKFPDVEVQLTGEDGNAFSIISRVRRALREHASGDQIEDFTKEAMAGDYDHVLQTVMAWVNVR